MAQDNKLAADTLWTLAEPQPKYIWVACCTYPDPGHARPISPHRIEDPDDDILCEVCRLPQTPMSRTAIERYQKGDRRCHWCQGDDHHKCTKVGCYGCPPELHRRTGVLATRTPGPM